PFCEKTREIWVKTHEFGAKSALLDGKMGKMSTEISNSSNGVAKMGFDLGTVYGSAESYAAKRSRLRRYVMP
ncbi:MAG: hypothetical protein OXD43_09220, partial [Bacteroidetes bacterium]|nr:hypothetical protein [Bacteroidota bacterium]